MDKEKNKSGGNTSDLTISNERTWNQFGDNVAGNKITVICNGRAKK